MPALKISPKPNNYKLVWVRLKAAEKEASKHHERAARKAMTLNAYSYKQAFGKLIKAQEKHKLWKAVHGD